MRNNFGWSIVVVVIISLFVNFMKMFISVGKQIKALIMIFKKRIMTRLYPGKYETKTIDL